MSRHAIVELYLTVFRKSAYHTVISMIFGKNISPWKESEERIRACRRQQEKEEEKGREREREREVDTEEEREREYVYMDFRVIQTLVEQQ